MTQHGELQGENVLVAAEARLGNTRWKLAWPSWTASDEIAEPAPGPLMAANSSGGKTSHGGLMKMSNKWLQWALLKAAWVAVLHDPYFRYQFALRCRTKGPKTAIIAVARRLAEIIW